MTATDPGAVAETAHLPAGHRNTVMWSLLRSRRAIVSASLLFLGILCVAAGPLVWRRPTEGQNLGRALIPPVSAGGTWHDPLGTDEFGRDILARLLSGGQIVIVLSAAAVLGAMILGVALGLWAGYVGGWVDSLLMRLADIQLAFPPFLLALAVLSGLQSGIVPLLSVMILSGWVQFARLVRGQVMVLREATYVEAAVGLGVTPARIVVRHLLRNSSGVVIVTATLLVSQMVILQAGLSFLGLGIQPPAPSWGGDLSDGLQYLTQAWWLTTMPGIALMITVVLVSILGDALRDILNPTLRDG